MKRILHLLSIIIIFTVGILVFFHYASSKAYAGTLIDNNPNFERNFPKFKEVVTQYYPEHIGKADYFAAQIEHESCASKSKCWNERSQLFTYEDLMSGKRREYGFGLGQITITNRFNNFEEIKKKNSNLRDWRFDQRFDAKRQIIALFTLNNICFNQVKFAEPGDDRYAMMFSCYNGGFGHIIKDRQLCIQKKGCNPNKWFGHVELDSVKSKVRKQGYGKSFFEINRDYPKDIMFSRNKKYKPMLKGLSKDVKEVKSIQYEDKTPEILKVEPKPVVKEVIKPTPRPKKYIVNPLLLSGNLTLWEFISILPYTIVEQPTSGR